MEFLIFYPHLMYFALVVLGATAVLFMLFVAWFFWSHVVPDARDYTDAVDVSGLAERGLPDYPNVKSKR